MALDVNALPFVDEHHVLVNAPVDIVWGQVGAMAGRSGPAGRVVASILATVPRRPSGDPLTQGAALTGFAVQEAVPGDRLVLVGRHRFSEYALIFTLAAEPGGTQVGGITRARFPGVRGRLYRALVIGSGGHRVMMMRMLRGIRRAAEA